MVFLALCYSCHGSQFGLTCTNQVVHSNVLHIISTIFGYYRQGCSRLSLPLREVSIQNGFFGVGFWDFFKTYLHTHSDPI